MCDLTQVEFDFLMSGTFELKVKKNMNISLRSRFLKFSLRALFSTRNFDENTCNTMHRFRPCLVVHLDKIIQLTGFQRIGGELVPLLILRDETD